MIEEQLMQVLASYDRAVAVAPWWKRWLVRRRQEETRRYIIQHYLNQIVRGETT